MNKSSSNKKAQTAKKEVASAKPEKIEKPVADSNKTDADSGSKETKDKPTKSSETGKGKSQKETISTSDVHYGYFSSVRTPAYRSGWDAIYGQKQPGKRTRPTVKASKQATKRATIKPPITVELDIDSLPEDLKRALENQVKIQLKPKRLNYDKKQSGGSVRWNISCIIVR